MGEPATTTMTPNHPLGQKGNQMSTYIRLLAVTCIVCTPACTSMITDPVNSITAFNPYITKDGVQSFRFVAKSKLPSYLESQDIRQIHETQISNELGKRQYCTRGYNIVSVTEVQGNNLVYEGVCK